MSGVVERTGVAVFGVAVPSGWGGPLQTGTPVGDGLVAGLIVLGAAAWAARRWSDGDLGILPEREARLTRVEERAVLAARQYCREAVADSEREATRDDRTGSTDRDESGIGESGDEDVDADSTEDADADSTEDAGSGIDVDGAGEAEPGAGADGEDTDGGRDSTGSGGDGTEGDGSPGPAVTVEAILANVYPDHTAGHTDERTWWTEAVGPGLDRTPGLSIPREADGSVATSGPIEMAEDFGPRGGEPDRLSPDEGERFDHYVRRGADGSVEVRVGDGERAATVRVHGRHDLRIRSSSSGADEAWLLEAREYVHEQVASGRIGTGSGADGEPAFER